MPKILVVDDEQNFIRLVEGWSKTTDWQIVATTKGSEALKLAAQEQPDIILLDVMMPDIDGTDVCQNLRANTQTSGIPIILITAYDPAVGRTLALMSGATDYLTKPVSLAEMEARIEAILGINTELPDQGETLLHEVTHSTLRILANQLVWILALDPTRRKLVSRSVATPQGKQGVGIFLDKLGTKSAEVLFSLENEKNPLIKAALSGGGSFNMTLANLRDQDGAQIAQACAALDLHYVSMIPLQNLGTPLGVMLLGSREPFDIETARGRQMLTAVASQASTVLNHVRLMRSLGQREAENKRERAFRQMLLDTMGDGLFVYNEHGEITYTNRRLTLMTGHPPETLLGARVLDLFHPNDHDRVFSVIARAGLIRTNSFESTLLKANQETLPVLVVEARNRDSEGAEVMPGGRVMVVTDMSAHYATNQIAAQQTGRLQALNRATRVINSSLSEDEAIDLILNEVVSGLDASAAAVLLPDDGGHNLVFHSCIGEHVSRVQGLLVPISDSIVGRAVKERETILIDDATPEEDNFSGIDEKLGTEIRSMAVTPLGIQDQIGGALLVMNKRHGTFNKYDQEILEGMARSTAGAIHNARLFEESRRRVDELTLLLQVSNAASSTLAIEQLVETVAEKMIDTLNVQCCSIATWEKSEDKLVTLAEVTDLLWPDGRRYVSLPDYKLAEEVLQTRQPLAAAASDPRVCSECREDLEGLGLQSVLLVPIIVDDRVVGFAELYFPEQSPEFTDEDYEALQTAMFTGLHTRNQIQSWIAHENIKSIAERLLETSKAVWCSILVYDEQIYVLQVNYELGRLFWSPGKGLEHVLDDDSVRRLSLIERSSLAIPIDQYALSRTDREVLGYKKTGTLLAVPLITRGDAIGLMQLVDTKPERVFSQSDLSLTQAIGNVVGNALTNARLYSTIIQRAAQLQAAYNDLQEADRIKGEWIQNVSHELRTPLASIVGFVNLVRDEDIGPLNEDQHKSLTAVVEQTERLSHLVESLLALQKMDRQPPERTHVLLSDLITRCVTRAETTAAKGNIQIETIYETKPDPLYIDPSRFYLALQALLDNGLKFSPPNSTVTITVRSGFDAQYIDITDQGIGIPAEEREKIWRRFYQVDGSMTRHYGGAGLGLAIVKQVVDQHGGHVSVRSEVGVGTTFSVMIPLVEPADFAI